MFREDDIERIAEQGAQSDQVQEFFKDDTSKYAHSPTPKSFL